MFSYFGLGIQMYSLFRKITNTEIPKSKSIVIPAKNEEGNLEELLSRIPKQIYSDIELIIVCGPSKDGTYQKHLNYKKTTIF